MVVPTQRQGSDMNGQTITMEMGMTEASVLVTALNTFVLALNPELDEFIAMEGKGTERTIQALSLKFVAVDMVRGILTTLGAPDEVVKAQVEALIGEE
jgi:hypothetical protein